MPCSYGGTLSQDLFWPGLWPEIRPVLHQRDLLYSSLQDLHHSLQLMDSLQNKVLEEIFQNTDSPQSLSHQLTTEGLPFILTLDARGFSPEELSVGQVDGTLRVQGRTEKKQEENSHSYYSVQEWTQELSLPKGLKTEELHCYLSADGTLRIQDCPNTCESETHNTCETDDTHNTGDSEIQTELPIRRLEEDRLLEHTVGHTEDMN